MPTLPEWWPLYGANLSDVEAAAAESMARYAARPARGALSDEQYKELLAGIVEAMAFFAGKIKRKE